MCVGGLLWATAVFGGFWGDFVCRPCFVCCKGFVNVLLWVGLFAFGLHVLFGASCWIGWMFALFVSVVVIVPLGWNCYVALY